MPIDLFAGLDNKPLCHRHDKGNILTDIERTNHFFNALNSAAIALQRVSHSEETVYHVFSKQIVSLGLHGSINLVDETGDYMVVKALAMPEKLLNLIGRVEALVRFRAVGYQYSLRPAQLDYQVMSKGKAIYLTNNSEKIKQVMPPAAQRFAALLMAYFARMPAILAPIVSEARVHGVLYVAGYQLTPDDVPPLEAFANQISIALENAFLFKEMQEARASLQQTNDSLVVSRDQLAQQMQMFDAVLSTTPETFIVYDANGRYQYASPPVLNQLNVTLDGFVGKTWRDFNIPPDIGMHTERECREVLQTGQSLTNEMEQLQNGEIRNIEYTLSPMRDAAGCITGVVSTTRDITERKRTQEAIYNAQRVESLGVMAGGVAHDFNNLLVAILGQTVLAYDKLPEGSETKGHLEKAIGAAERAADLTRQLLAYSGRGRFEVRPLNLNDLLQDNTHLLQVAIPRHITFSMDLMPNLPHIEADAGQIQQVVMNLILNAAEAIGEAKGSIRLKTFVSHIDSQMLNAWQFAGHNMQTGDFVMLHVQDDGVGMDATTLARIFEPFFSTKFTGRGLGLAAVMGIMRGHHGGIRLSSELGEGTTFKVAFPVSTAEPVVTTEKAEPARPAQLLLNKGVLVIDDEQTVLDAMQDILELEKSDVFTATDGRSGVEFYEQNCEKISLVLLDLSMPGMNGIETLAALQEVNPNVFVVLLSGYSELEVLQKLPVDIKHVSFVQKPFQIQTLLTHLRQRLSQ